MYCQTLRYCTLRKHTQQDFSLNPAAILPRNVLEVIDYNGVVIFVLNFGWMGQIALVCLVIQLYENADWIITNSEIPNKGIQ